MDYELKKAITDFNRNMRAKKVRLLPIGKGMGRTLLYIYRPDKLEKDLNCRQCMDFLRKMGYPVGRPCACIKEYADRLSRSKCFLHEIGFFLGYPSEDVISFIEKGPEKSLCCGVWRAYTEKEKAIRAFEQFKQCRENYYFSWKAGKSLNELTPTI